MSKIYGGNWVSDIAGSIEKGFEHILNVGLDAGRLGCLQTEVKHIDLNHVDKLNIDYDKNTIAIDNSISHKYMYELELLHQQQFGVSNDFDVSLI